MIHSVSVRYIMKITTQFCASLRCRFAHLGEGRWEVLIGNVRVGTVSRDRVSAGLVCSRWFSALHSPVLWRSMRVVLCSPCGEERLAAMFLRRYGGHVRSLELRWSRPLRGGSAAAAGASTRAAQPLGTSTALERTPTAAPSQTGQRAAIEPTLGLLTQLEALKADLQVTKLSLVDWVFSYKWSSQRPRLLAALANFLG